MVGNRRIRARALATVVAVLSLGMVGGAAASPPPSSNGDRVKIIGVFEDSVSNPRAAAQDIERRHNGRLSFVYEHALKGFAGEFPQASLSGLQRDPRVEFVELDQAVSIAAQQTPTGVDRILANKTTLGIDGSDDLRVDVDVAVLDTGVDFEHPDLNVNVAGSVTCAYGSWRNNSCTSGGDDDHYHGTHVAGSVGALDNGIGVVGVAPGARIWSVKVLNQQGSGYMSWIAAGIDYVKSKATDIEVANMSLGCECSSDAVTRAIDGAVKAGVVFAVAAGNSDSNTANFFPANHADVIAVSALADFNGLAGGGAASTCRNDQDDTLADFSNWGSRVDIAAPGVCILSTYPLERGEYASISGTSMASPHVAGAAALYASRNNPADRNAVLAIRTLLKNEGNTDWTDDSGDGFKETLLDISDAVFNPVLVSSGGGGGTTPVVDNAPIVSISSPANGSAHSTTSPITFTGSASDDGTDISGSLAWTSDRDGQIGTGGASVTDTLTAGSHTITASATDGGGKTGTASITITVNAPASGSTALVVNESYTQFGGKNSDNHLDLTFNVTAGTSGVAGAEVAFNLYRDGSPVGGTTRGTTDSAGNITFSYRGIGPGCYNADVLSITKSGYTWDSAQPVTCTS